MKKLLGLLGALTLVTTSSATVVACNIVIAGSPSSKNPEGNDKSNEEKNPDLSSREDLNKTITNTFLGSFKTVPTRNELWTIIQERYSELILEELEMGPITKNLYDYSLVISVKQYSSVYKPESMILTFDTFAPGTRKELKEVIKVTNLGVFESINLTDEEILTRVFEKNPLADLEMSNLSIFSTIDNEMRIVFNTPSDEYVTNSSVRVSYRKNKVFVNADWTRFSIIYSFDSVPTKQEILERILKNNPNLDITQLVVEGSPLDGMVYIHVKSDSSVYIQDNTHRGINIKIKTMKNLSQDLKKINLGVFDQIPTEEEFLAKLKELNSELQVDQLTVTKNIMINTFTVGVIEGSSVYYGKDTILVSFDIKGMKDLQDDLRNTYRGEFEYWPDEKEILDWLVSLNPNLAVDEIELKLNSKSESSFTVSVKYGSSVYYYATEGSKLTWTYFFSVKEKTN